MALKIYGAPISTCTARIVIVYHEKQIPFKLIIVEFQKGEHQVPVFLKHQPFGQIPYIVRF
ncbi:hypothetical protein L218DRAFT_843604, partial [Marasmius fiardii PR-910]